MIRSQIRSAIRPQVRRVAEVARRYFTELSKGANQYYRFDRDFVISGDFEVAFSVYLNQYGNTMFFSGGTGALGFELFMNGTGNLSFRYQGSAPSPYTESAPMPLHEISVVRVVRSGDTVSLVINDRVSFQAEVAGDVSLRNIGQRYGSSSFGLDGILFDLGIWMGGDRSSGERVFYTSLADSWRMPVSMNTAAELGRELFSVNVDDWTTHNATMTFVGNKVRVTNTANAQGTATIPLHQSAGDSIFLVTGERTGQGEAWLANPFFGVGTPGYRQTTLNNGGAFTIRSNTATTGAYVEYELFTIKKVVNRVPAYLTSVNISASDASQYTFDAATNKWVGDNLLTQSVWENPVTAGADWRFDHNQWILTGSGDLSVLLFWLAADQPEAFRLSGNVLSLSGEGAGLRATNSSIPDSLITAQGAYSLDSDKTTVVSQLFKRASGVVNATIDKPRFQRLLEYNATLLEAPDYLAASVRYDGWTGVEAISRSDGSVSSYLWIGSRSQTPSDRQIISGNGAVYTKTKTALNEQYYYGSVNKVDAGQYRAWMALQDSYGNITRSESFDITQPNGRRFIRFNTSGSQRIELSSNILVGNRFEIEVYIYIPEGETGTVIAGESFNNSTIAIDVTQTSIRFFAYDSTGQVQSPIKSVTLSINNLYNRWVKVIAKLDEDVPYLEVDNVVSGATGTWSGGGGQPPETNIRYIGMRESRINCFEGYIANLKIWTGGGRYTGVVAEEFLLDGLNTEYVLDNNSNFGPDILDNKEPLVPNDIRRVLVHSSYEHLVRIENAEGLSWHDGLGVTPIQEPLMFVSPRPGSTGELNLYNSSDSEYDMADVVVRPFQGHWGKAINLDDADTTAFTYNKVENHWQSPSYPNLLENSADIAGSRWSLVTSTVTDQSDGSVLVQHNSNSGRLATVVLSDLETNGQSFTVSIEVKEGVGSGFFRLLVVDNLSTPVNHINMWVDTAAMAVSRTVAAGTGVLTGASVENLNDDGWMKVTLSGQLNGISKAGLWLYITDSNGSTLRSLTVSQYWRKPQLNLGSEALPYQETVGEAGYRLKISE